MAARYTPDELEFYLLDFKEGVSFAQFAPGRRDPTLAAARPPDRGQRQHRPGVRAGAAAVPVRRDAPRAPRSRRSTRSRKLEELRERRPGRALAADRRGDRRVPVPVRRARRGHPRGHRGCWRTWPGAAARRASTWCWPARTCRASRRSGAVRRSSSSSSCGSRLPRARRILAETNDAALGAAALARRDQPRVRDEARQRDRPHSRRHRQGRGRRRAAAAVRALRGRVGGSVGHRLFDGSQRAAASRS